MLPPGHLAVGYLVYSALARYRQTLPGPAETIALAVATQLPDLVDKPLSWTLGVLPTGRSLAHSVITAAVVIAVAFRVGRSIDRPALGPAVGIGYGSHLAGDLLSAILSDSEGPLFLLWPLVSQEGYAVPPTFGQYSAVWIWALSLALYLGAFAAVAAVVWNRNGRSERAYAGFVVPAVAATVGAALLIGVGSAWFAVETALLQFAVAVWVRDGAPGVPRWRN